MKPAAFAYAKAMSLDHVFDLAEGHGEDSRILAGGQSLIASLNMRLSAPALLIDINGLHDLAEITLDGGFLRIGALARHASVARSTLVAEHAPLIAKAMPFIAHAAIRNRGTFGGSIAFADPAAELPACIVALEAEIEIASRGGTRRVAATSFFKDLYETDLKPDEVLTAVYIPLTGDDGRAGFSEISRRHGDYAIAGLAASARAQGDRLSDIRLAFFGVGPTPIRVRSAEAALAEGSLDDAVAALGDDLDPPDDVDSNDATRLHLSRVLLRRVVAGMQGEA